MSRSDGQTIFRAIGTVEPALLAIRRPAWGARIAGNSFLQCVTPELLPQSTVLKNMAGPVSKSLLGPRRSAVQVLKVPANLDGTNSLEAGDRRL
jgi:hypothetical protein